jgi:hypothetical protein
MSRFNEETPDDPHVSYYSFSAEFTPSWSNPFRIPWGVVYEREGPNDGLVSVQSARWGDHRATLHNVNHAGACLLVMTSCAVAGAAFITSASP